MQSPNYLKDSTYTLSSVRNTRLWLKKMNPKASSFVRALVLLNFLFFSSIAANNISKSTTPPPSVPQKEGKCPKDTLKFGVCGSWLGLVTEVIGTKPSEKCCTLVKGLADLEAALCLCTAIKAKVLGIVKVEMPVAVSLLVNSCGKKVPSGFDCA
ncbi:putative lipid-binding protein At4g00165 [Abrus precatorius]|uniref:Lipid-binding protein At4g00165 n=1 Tax=Abrus precatorius TaxID=3816 RepID=A0A8B8JZ69_ABRPR|nr:putative lipid-binding protein At4g00165 [Abrus precatorius]